MTTIFVTFTQEGWHCWPTAPPEVAYLKVRHRHLFHFRVEVQVNHADRLIEFHQLKTKCLRVLHMEWQRSPEPFQFGLEFEGKSCEAIAVWLLGVLEDILPGKLWMACEVSEDGECGARVEVRP